MSACATDPSRWTAEDARAALEPYGPELLARLAPALGQYRMLGIADHFLARLRYWIVERGWDAWRAFDFAEHDAEQTPAYRRADHAVRTKIIPAVRALQARANRPDHVVTVTRSAPRARGAGRPRAQASRRSSTSRDDGDDGPGEPGPQLALAAPPRALLTFACLTAEQRGELAVEPIEARR